MFDSQPAQPRGAGPDASTTLSLVAQTRRQVLEHECKLIELAAHWSDLHHPDSQAPAEKPLPGAERGRQLGGDGTPEVLEFAAAELGASLHTSVGSAKAMMADALDLQHRLPQLWQLILTGGVAAWKARKVAQATRHLSRDAARAVDAAVAGAIATLPWGRFENLLAGKIIEADPYAADQQAKIWEAERFVRCGRTNQAGLKLLIAKANAGHVIWFMATVNRIAEILRLRGDLDTAEVRRSKAIGIIAQPAVALQLLWEFRNQQHPGSGESQQPDEPIDNEAEAPFDTTTTPPADDEPDSEPDWPTQPGFCWPTEPSEQPAEPAQESTDSASESAAPVEPEAEPAGCGLIIRPSGIDTQKLRPKAVLHIHLSQEALAAYTDSKQCLVGGAARLEGVGALTLGQVRRFLHGSGCHISIQPVIDPQDVPPVDGYEIPRVRREAVVDRVEVRDLHRGSVAAGLRS
jgi:Domain of unknown function (DUF222)